MCICNEHLCTSTHTQSHVLCSPPEQKGLFVWSDCSDKLPSLFLRCPSIQPLKSWFESTAFNESYIKERPGTEVCVCGGEGMCMWRERCMEKKNRKAKNQGMLGFVCTAKNVLKAGKWGRVWGVFFMNGGSPIVTKGSRVWNRWVMCLLHIIIQLL